MTNAPGILLGKLKFLPLECKFALNNPLHMPVHVIFDPMHMLVVDVFDDHFPNPAQRREFAPYDVFEINQSVCCGKHPQAYNQCCFTRNPGTIGKFEMQR